MTVSINDVDKLAPKITGPSGNSGDRETNKTIDEHGSTAIHTFSANETVTWALNGGADSAKFDINSSTGALTFKSVPNFETPSDSGSDNTYEVKVKATDLEHNSSEQLVKIKVDNISEPAPSISGPSGNDGDLISEKYIDENSTVIHTFTVGNSSKYSTNITWSLNGGKEESLFEINSKTGALKLKSAPDYENPKDLNKHNKYKVRVRATDNLNKSSEQEITVRVKDLNESSFPEIIGPFGVIRDKVQISVNSGSRAIFNFKNSKYTTLNWSLGGKDASLFEISHLIIYMIIGNQ